MFKILKIAHWPEIYQFAILPKNAHSLNYFNSKAQLFKKISPSCNLEINKKL